ncbi:SEC-C metal-binding domain-containing protein [Pectobacterium brasiliense]|uniref:SEC-C metal-binding domain-containing protein n=1 Tax=Pectobacterium brasiliense TaxID=180957 RepID=UPI000D4127FC|nr:SEC-C metal-binding domain-containing protein [Pectobacterium brasiliense]MBN3229670.1 SEC-C domain-containing protein [Pectobacterium brasiliense]PPE61413.1 protein translocase subunit SecA [Pectobacterium brasiliense]
MLSPIKKESGITDSERFLAKVIDKTFFSIWSYPNVYTDEGFSKNKQGKELCDLLVIIDKTAIIFSDKDIKFNTDIDIKIAWKRWFKRSIVESANQLFGAANAIKSKRNRLFLDKKCTVDFPISLEDIREFHLIAITKNIKNVVKKYFSSKSGSLMCIFPYQEKECLEHPFTIGDLYPEKSFIHFFDDYSFNILMNELNTVTDFTSYLKSKTHVIRNKSLITSTGEEEILASFIRGMIYNKEIVGKIHFPVPEKLEKYGVQLIEGLWDELLYDSNYIEVKRNILKFNYIDDLAKRLSDCILNGTVGINKDNTFNSHERAVRYLSLEPRVSRAIISQAISEKYDVVPKNVRSARLIPSLYFKGRVFIMIYFPRETNEPYEEYRDKRINLMYSYCLVAKLLNKEYKEFIAIATEPQFSIGRSEDIIYLEYESDLSDSDKKLAQELRKEGVFNDIKNTKIKLNNILDNQRTNEIHDRKIGRNSPCRCGSGKKYKKCCGR